MELLSVGDVAGRLGVTPSTVRMWGSRYGMTASGRTPGGHRRYTMDDLSRLQRVHTAVVSGLTPANAAATELGVTLPAPTTGPSSRRSGAGGSVLAVPGAGPRARGVARAASRLDEMAVEDAVIQALRDEGTLATWQDVIRPVLVSAGEYWQRTGNGIEIEHLLSQAVSTAFVRHVAEVIGRPQDPPVLLAAGPRDEHVLALHAVRAALAERGVPSRLLGPRTPVPALVAAAKRTRALAAFVWLSTPDDTAVADLPMLAKAHRRITIVVGGPGWAGADVGGAHRCTDLAGAVDELVTAATKDSTG
ncbi:MerR family transcriptional regulator [Dermatophilaceae bacterium Sec6.4]|nr:MerR family transcriptional regulator [Actinomycetota bacterium]